MATKRTSAKNNKKEFQPIDCGNDFFLHWRENDYGLFGLEHGGAIIYGCRLVETNDGRVFLSYPARKGKDDKYYVHARFTDRIPDDVIEVIANAIGF